MPCWGGRCHSAWCLISPFPLLPLKLFGKFVDMLGLKGWCCPRLVVAFLIFVCHTGTKVPRKTLRNFLRLTGCLLLSCVKLMSVALGNPSP